MPNQNLVDFHALARARKLNIPADAIDRAAAAMQTLEDSFRPLLAKLPHTVEPAITLSEKAVLAG